MQYISRCRNFVWEEGVFHLYGFSQDISNVPSAQGNANVSKRVRGRGGDNMEAFRTAKNVVAVISLLHFPPDLDMGPR